MPSALIFQGREGLQSKSNLNKKDKLYNEVGKKMKISKNNE